MEVKEFVSQTIIEIIDGIKLAQEYAAKNKATVNAGPMSMNKTTSDTHTYLQANPQTIEFDLLVTEQDSSEAKHGIAVLFVPVGANANSKENSLLTSANRVHFSVSVAFPKQ